MSDELRLVGFFERITVVARRRIWLSFGAWLSLVEHSVRDRGVGGSNPLAPTKFSQRSPFVL